MIAARYVLTDASKDYTRRVCSERRHVSASSQLQTRVATTPPRKTGGVGTPVPQQDLRGGTRGTSFSASLSTPAHKTGTLATPELRPCSSPSDPKNRTAGTPSECRDAGLKLQRC